MTSTSGVVVGVHPGQLEMRHGLRHAVRRDALGAQVDAQCDRRHVLIGLVRLVRLFDLSLRRENARAAPGPRGTRA